ncbi:hypothetical protein [Salipaludibacillus aurantiacus]|uniref:IclR helix-turn-helix domain-containing protein n=1 Tax=Salipaludibacillus aurantiacus TaxID=1601833 RepID=A0A1H9VCP7_9BACI|nr:hypothetical protein [Salipaludibacillus aurantiacus]SES19053.1 hypothetical protein SAMN05518684_11064 [Salipaludibacillus aurantiacus]
MACVNGNGKLTQSAKNILQAVENSPKSPADLSRELAIPMFKIRSSMRDMASMGLVQETEGAYQLAPGGKKMLDKSN